MDERKKYVMTEDKNFEDIASAIRFVDETTATYKPSEMAEAIVTNEKEIEYEMRNSDLFAALYTNYGILISEANYTEAEVLKTTALVEFYELLYNREEVQNGE